MLAPLDINLHIGVFYQVTHVRIIYVYYSVSAINVILSFLSSFSMHALWSKWKPEKQYVANSDNTIWSKNEHLVYR